MTKKPPKAETYKKNCDQKQRVAQISNSTMIAGRRVIVNRKQNKRRKTSGVDAEQKQRYQQQQQRNSDTLALLYELKDTN